METLRFATLLVIYPLVLTLVLSSTPPHSPCTKNDTHHCYLNLNCSTCLDQEGCLFCLETNSCIPVSQGYAENEEACCRNEITVEMGPKACIEQFCVSANCTECTAKPYCVWCEAEELCLSGNVLGPFANTKCTNWRWQRCSGGEGTHTTSPNSDF